jgi:multiple sugar transport system permease protein/N-acetylglucosamine transport system permease protein
MYFILLEVRFGDKNMLGKLFNLTPANERKLKKYLFIYGMLSLAIINFLLFWLYVNVNSILLAFQQTTTAGIKYTLENFNMLFREFGRPDSLIIQSIKNTLIFFVAGLFVVLPLSLIFSYFIYKKVLFYRFFRVIFFLPSIISAVVFVSIFKTMLSPDGPFEVIYTKIFNSYPPMLLTDSRYSLWTIVFYCVWLGFGMNIVLFNGALSRIPGSLIESAMIEGVTPFQEVVYIIIPLIWPTISTLIILSMVGLFTASGPILLFTQGAHDTYTVSYWIFVQVTKYRSYEYSSAVGLFFTVIALPIVFTVKYLLGKVTETIEY